MTSMTEDLDHTKNHWKTSSKKEDLHGIWHQLTMTSMEDEINRR